METIKVVMFTSYTIIQLKSDEQIERIRTALDTYDVFTK